MFVVAEAVGVVFDGSGAIETPVVLGDGDGVLGFDGADGGEGVEEALFESIIGEAVGVIHDVELAGEAMLTRNVGTRPASVGITRNGVKDRT